MSGISELTVRIHSEDGALWAEVLEHPGCFATGDDLPELLESLREGLSLILGEDIGELHLGEPPQKPQVVERRLELA